MWSFIYLNLDLMFTSDIKRKTHDSSKDIYKHKTGSCHMLGKKIIELKSNKHIFFKAAFL